MRRLILISKNQSSKLGSGHTTAAASRFEDFELGTLHTETKIAF